MLPARNTLRAAASWPGTWNQGILVVRQGGVGSAPATIINGVAALGCGAQYRRLLAVRRTSIVPPCQPCLSPSHPPRTPASSLPFLVLPPFFAHYPPSFADIDEPPCALLSSTWTPPTESQRNPAGWLASRNLSPVFCWF